MNLTQFLASCSDKKNLFEDISLISFQGQKEFPLLFFSLYFTWLKKNVSSPIETIDVSEYDLATIVAKLETSFLGNRVVYWLRNLSAVEEKKRLKISTYLSSYNGSNCIIFFSNSREKLDARAVIVEMQDLVSKQDFIAIFSFFEGELFIKRSTVFIQSLFARVENIPFDQACALMRYAKLVGSNQQEFVEQWLDSLLISEKSLFLLSQYFFAKSPKKFFTYWAKIGTDYSEPFWITFWSEQIWRSYHYVELMRQKKFAEAKGVAFRLPFSLIQTDWQKLNTHELKTAHNFLYSMDFSLKNGGNSFSLDLFYSKFFLNQF